MEMYADPEARGGVLEPEGTVEIRFRPKDLVKAMHRCDTGCKSIDSQLSDPNITAEERMKLEARLKDREQQLLGMYHQVALSFADLHDTPVRMLDKGVICDIIPWHRSRYLLFWRMRRLLFEDNVKNEIQRVTPNKSDAEMHAMIRRWFIEQHGQHNQYLWDDNRCVAEWLHSQLEGTTSQVLSNIQCIQRDALTSQLQRLFKEFPTATFDSMVQLIHSDLSQQQRSDLLTSIVSLEGTSPVSTNKGSVVTSPTSDVSTSEAVAENDVQETLALLRDGNEQ